MTEAMKSLETKDAPVRLQRAFFPVVNILKRNGVPFCGLCRRQGKNKLAAVACLNTCARRFLESQAYTSPRRLRSGSWQCGICKRQYAHAVAVATCLNECREAFENRVARLFVHFDLPPIHSLMAEIDQDIEFDFAGVSSWRDARPPSAQETSPEEPPELGTADLNEEEPEVAAVPAATRAAKPVSTASVLPEKITKDSLTVVGDDDSWENLSDDLGSDDDVMADLDCLNLVGKQSATAPAATPPASSAATLKAEAATESRELSCIDLDESIHVPTKTAHGRPSRRDKWIRSGGKYQCLGCRKLHFTKTEAEICSDGHEAA